MKRSLVPLALVLCLALPALAAPEPSQPVLPRAGTGASNPADESYARGLQALSAGQPDEARRAFNEALKANDRHVMAMLALAELAFQNKNDTELKRWLQKAEQTEPNNVHVLLTLGRYHLTRDQASKAESVLTRAVDAQPKNLQALIDLADAHSRQRDHAKAAMRLRQAAELAPQSAQVQQLLGLALMRNGKPAEAEKHLLKAAELEPQSPEPLLLLAQMETKAAGATKYIDQALQRAPQSYDGLMMRAYWQHQAGDTAGARRTLDSVMKLYPKLAEPWVRLGMLASAEKRTADARSAYKAALERDANHPVALNNLAMISLEAGENPSVAEGMIRKALKVLPNNGALQDTLAAVLVAKKDARGALAAIQLAAKLSPNDPGIQLHLAEILLLNGDKVGAKRAAESVKAGPGVDAARLSAVLRKAGA